MFCFVNLKKILLISSLLLVRCSLHAAASSSSEPMEDAVSINQIASWIEAYQQAHPGATYMQAYDQIMSSGDRPILKKAKKVARAPGYVEDFRDYLEEKHINCCLVDTRPAIDHDLAMQIIAGYPRGLNDAIKAYHYPWLYKHNLVRLFLLAGHSGVGKSSLATILSNVLEYPLLHVKCSSIGTEWQNSDTQNLARILIPIINSNDPWVVLLDEMDSMDKSSGDRGSKGRAVSQELHALLDKSKNSKLIIVCTTNYAMEIGKELKYRLLSGAYEILLPDTETRKNIIRTYLEKENIACPEDVLEYLVKNTGGYISSRGFSGRDLRELVREVARIVLTEFVKKIPLYERSQEFVMSSLAKSKLVVTKGHAESALDSIKMRLASVGLASTEEGKRWQAFRDSKDFFETMNLSIAVTQTVISASGLALSAYSAYHQKVSTDANLEIARRQLALAETQAVHQNFIGYMGIAQGEAQIQQSEKDHILQELFLIEQRMQGQTSREAAESTWGFWLRKLIFGGPAGVVDQAAKSVAPEVSSEGRLRIEASQSAERRASIIEQGVVAGTPAPMSRQLGAICNVACEGFQNTAADIQDIRHKLFPTLEPR